MDPKNVELPVYLFHEGTNYEAYKFMCPQHVTLDGKDGWIFRVWAPQARGVSVVGEFNNWEIGRHRMNKISVGVWEAFIEGAKQYDTYKFAVEQCNGGTVFKANPFATHSQTPPENASKLYEMSYVWSDEKWMEKRSRLNPFRAPMNIYEINAGSWRRYADGNVYNYRKLAEELIPYLKMMHYTL